MLAEMAAAVDPQSLFDANGAPDWGRISFDVLCSRCDYNLRGLPQPRCPECGLEFVWFDVLHRATHSRTGLFDQSRSVFPFFDFWRSLLGAMRPTRFWASVSIHDPLRLRPLVVMLALAPVVFVGTLVLFENAVSGWLTICGYPQPTGSGRRISTFLGWLAARWWNCDWQISHAYIRLQSHAAALIGATAGDSWVVRRITNWTFCYVIALYLAGSTLTLAMLRETLARCKTRPVQMVRVAAYAALPLCGVFGMLICADILVHNLFQAAACHLRWGNTKLANVANWLRLIAWSVIVGAVFLHARYLTVGLRNYLKLPRPRAAAGIAIVVGAMLAFTVAMIVLTRSPK